jgi:hypothetical protein
VILTSEFKTSEELAAYLNKEYSDKEHFSEIKTILKIGYEYELLPAASQKSAKTDKKLYLDWFFSRYKNCREKNSLCRVGNPMGTSPDKLVDHILIERFGYNLSSPL